MSKYLVRMWFSIPTEVFDVITDTAERVAGIPVPFWTAGVLEAKVKREKKLIEGRRAAAELIEDYEAEFGPIPGAAQERARQTLAPILTAREERDRYIKSLFAEIPTGSAASMRRVRIAVRPETADAIRDTARRTGRSTSAWAAEVLFTEGIETALEQSRQEAVEDEGLRAAQELVAECEARSGPIPKEIWQEADEFVAELRTDAPDTGIETQDA